MPHTLAVEMACISLFLGMSLLSMLFFRLGRNRLGREETAPEVSGAIIGAVFALLGLLLAFTYSEAHSRFDARRHLIVQEANAIGTAYLQLDLLPSSTQAPLRETLREYTASRIALYEKLTDLQAVRRELVRTGALEKMIWSRAVAASAGPEYQATRLLLLPTLNEMFDLVTTRSVAIQTHPPLLIFVTVFAIAFTCAGLTGYRAGVSQHSSPNYNIIMAAITAFVLYLILDIEYPRHGLVRLDTVNRVLVELLETMK